MKTNPQAGNILFLILLAVVLFAALSYAVTQSTNGGVKDASPEKLSAQVSEIMNQTAAMDLAITRLRSRGCSDTQISFQSSAVTTFPHNDYSNTNAPDDKSCNVFDQAGAGLNPLKSTFVPAPDNY